MAAGLTQWMAAALTQEIAAAMAQEIAAAMTQVLVQEETASILALSRVLAGPPTGNQELMSVVPLTGKQELVLAGLPKRNQE